MFVLLRRKRGIDRRGFSRHWLDTHGPLVARQAEFWSYTLRYKQNHVQGDGDEPFDGIAVSTQRYDRPAGGFPSEACYLQVVRPDERRFMDHEAIVRFTAHQTIVREGAEDGRKVMLLLKAEQLRPCLDQLAVSEASKIVSHLRRGAVSAGSEAVHALCGIKAVVQLWSTRDQTDEGIASARRLSLYAVDVVAHEIQKPTASRGSV